MKRNTLQRYGTLVAAATGVFLGRAANATTEITFGSFTPNATPDSTAISSIAGYGSNVGASGLDYNVSIGVSGVLGTPGIGLTWGLGYESYRAWDGRGDVGQLDYWTAGEVSTGVYNPIDLLFTPSAGSGVLVNSFDLDEWAGGGKGSVSWSLFDSNGPLASGLFTKSTAGGRTTILTGLTTANVNIGLPVTLRLGLNAGEPSYFALDNLIFDQVQVPEPGMVSLGLLGAGLGVMAMRRRKQE
jgi:hypothetical protein